MQSMKEPKRVFFPQDETEHNHIIEWWYFNGNLEDRKGNRYAFMNSLFKADIKRVKFPIISKFPIPVKTLYSSHSILSDLENRKFYPRINYAVWPSHDSFKDSTLFTKYGDCLIKKTGKNKYHIKNENVDLRMTSMKPPMLEGGMGFLRFFGPESTYYYSLSNLKTEGTVTIGDKKIRVSGKSWMDHQWANSTYDKARWKWTWFSIQLDNNTDIVCYEYGKSNRKIVAIMDPKGVQENTKDIKFKPTGIYWTSPHTKTVYPLSWRIEIPSKNIRLDVKPIIKEQEMLFGTINYWEGPLIVRGTMKNKKVKGKGFLELAGYKPKYRLSKIIQEELERLIMQEFNDVKRITKSILD